MMEYPGTLAPHNTGSRTKRVRGYYIKQNNQTNLLLRERERERERDSLREREREREREERERETL